jgi:hypothetical protein
MIVVTPTVLNVGELLGVNLPAFVASRMSPFAAVNVICAVEVPRTGFKSCTASACVRPRCEKWHVPVVMIRTMGGVVTCAWTVLISHDPLIGIAGAAARAAAADSAGRVPARTAAETAGVAVGAVGPPALQPMTVKVRRRVGAVNPRMVTS